MTVNSIRKVKKYIITFCITYLLLLKLPLYICQSRQGESIKGIKQDKNTSVKFESESLLIMKFMLEPFLFRLLNNISLWNEVVFKKTYMQIKKTANNIRPGVTRRQMRLCPPLPLVLALVPFKSFPLKFISLLWRYYLQNEDGLAHFNMFKDEIFTVENTKNGSSGTLFVNSVLKNR